MSGISCIAIMLGVLAQQAAPAPPANARSTPPSEASAGAPMDAQTAPPPPPRIQMLAIQATKEERAEPYFDEALKELEEPLKQLPFDTFKQIAAEQKECPLGEEATFNIDDTFRVVVRTGELPAQPTQPGTPPDAAGAAPQPQALMVHGRVEMKTGDSYINALSADAILPANQFLQFRGIPRENGAMLALITPSMGQQQQQQEQNQDQQEKNEQERQEQEQEQKQDEEQQEKPQEGQTQPDKPNSDEDQEQEQQTSEAQEDKDKPKDMQNIEAILQSLEELDEQEQHNLREVPNVRKEQGAWW